VADRTTISKQQMEDFYDFEAVFGSLKDVEFRRNAIKNNRRGLEGELFVDRLLKAIGVARRQSRLVTHRK